MRYPDDYTKPLTVASLRKEFASLEGAAGTTRAVRLVGMTLVEILDVLSEIEFNHRMR